jgi:hypothetical protein
MTDDERREALSVDRDAIVQSDSMPVAAVVALLLDLLIAETDGTKFGAEWFTKARTFTAFEFDRDAANGFVILRDGDGEDGDGRWPLLSLPKPRNVAEAYCVALPSAVERYGALWAASDAALRALED